MQSNRYSLPNKYHDVVEDITQLSRTLQQIDNDIVKLEGDATKFAQDTEIVKDSVIHAGTHLRDGTIKDIAPKRFVVINDEGDGLSCVDGGGAKGGTTAQCSIKKSNADFDITYANITDISKHGMTVQENAETGEGGQFHIFSDEAEEANNNQLPRKNVINHQVVDNFELQTNESVILKNEIEPLYENDELATKLNYGVVKIGTNIVCTDGIMAAKPLQTATKKRPGIVQIGDGINIENGIISPASAVPATRETAGTVKLSGDFEVNENGQLELGNMADASIIYKLSRAKSVYNGNIDLEEKTLIYKALVTTDMMFTINTNFVATDDFTFVLELISDGMHIVKFEDMLKPISQTMPINRGITRMYFTKKLGYPHYDVEVSRADAPEPVNLTPSGHAILDSNFLVWTPGGCNWNPYGLLLTSYEGYSNARELRFEFETLVCVDYVNYISRNQETPLTEFTLRGSNDGQNWTTLLHKENEIIYGKVYTEKKGCFRYYDLIIGWTNDNNKPSGATLWGTQIDNNTSELKALTPQMANNTTNYAKFTASKIVDGNVTNITNDVLSARMIIGSDEENQRWCQYELTPAAAANLLEMYFDTDGRQANWFKLEGSLDGENWNLLVERQWLKSTFFSGGGYKTLYIPFENETEYKYYRLSCLATDSTEENWYLNGFKLYRRQRGKHNFYGNIPILKSAEQDGYMVSAGSVANSDNVPYYAFDGNKDTKWTSVNNVNAERWLQIKLPTATICTTALLKATLGAPEYTPSTFEIQGSADGENFTTLASFEEISWSAGEEKIFDFENQEAYLYYRINVQQTMGNIGYAALAEVNFGHSKYEYKRLLDKYNYIVPILTGETTTTDEGVYRATRSDNSWGGGNAWNLFSRGNDTMEYYNMIETWTQIEIPIAKVVNSFSIKARPDEYCTDTARDYKLCGSNNGTAWTTLFEISNSPAWGRNETRTHNIENEQAYKFYRLYFSNPAGRNVCSIAAWDLFEHQVIQEY